MKLVTTKFKSGGLHEKHVVATWNLGNHLSIYFQAQGNQEVGWVAVYRTLPYKLGDSLNTCVLWQGRNFRQQNLHFVTLTIKPTRCTKFLKFIFGIKLYMFRTVPLSTMTIFFSVHTAIHTGLLTACEQCQDGLILLASCQRSLYDIYHSCVYREKLLMIDRGTVRNMQRFITKINLRNSVHLIGFIIRIYHDARSQESTDNNILVSVCCQAKPPFSGWVSLR